MLTRRFESERGSSLLAILLVMAIGAMLLLATAPTVTHEVQRQKELESIRRGEEVAEAIARFVEHYRGARLPISMEELLEGLPSGTRRIQILRESASRDPLSADGRWRLIKPDDPNLVRFGSKIQELNKGTLPPSRSQTLDRFALPLSNLIAGNRGGDGGVESVEPGDSFDGVPFIGVASQSKLDAIISFYDLEKHSEWVFTPLFKGSQGRFSGRAPGPQNPMPRRPWPPQVPPPDAQER